MRSLARSLSLSLSLSLSFSFSLEVICASKIQEDIIRETEKRQEKSLLIFCIEKHARVEWLVMVCKCYKDQITGSVYLGIWIARANSVILCSNLFMIGDTFLVFICVCFLFSSRCQKFIFVHW